ncbi:hypothetical protein A8C56_20230 [Niabella ginsenosidivorans]|uniref:PIN domain-containing protein n=1 Tax=Niabella ginsenosidivorans TaxID=1176587 RepID=A0A1A9I8K2_9BACT|nr:type II toxin-antitoxin system VapC family toxin [Niabella ginsenosidivorans]ANH83001.1 hypothetical protein A8C56_20230 [Niabella ginsenosidivorans]
MGKKYLIDSNCVIDFCNGKLPAPAQALLFALEQPVISVITQIGVLRFDITNEKKEKLLNLQVALKTIEIKKKARIKLPDAVIAATAIQFNAVLLTGNVTDFKNVSELNLQNPRDL